MSITGFANRRKRISRRMERDTFREVIMPAAYVVGALGFLGLLGVIIYASASDVLSLEAAGLSGGLLAIPCVLQVYRVFRGHYSRSLNEP